MKTIPLTLTISCLLSLLLAGDATQGAGPLPEFTFQGVALHPQDLKYTPTGDLIHPTIIKTEGRIKNPLGKFYLYYAPHKHVAISMAYSDSIEGPWKEYQQNPVIEGPSAPDIRWIAEQRKFFMWGHRKNSQTELWTSEDGIHFDYHSVSVSAKNIGTRNATYTRVYEYPLERYGSKYIMLYSGFLEDRGIRCVWLAHSKDAENWVQLKTPLVEPIEGEVNDAYGPALLRWKGRNFVVYQDHTTWRGGNIKYVELDRDLNPVGAEGQRYVLLDPADEPPLNNRYRGGEFYFENGKLYLYSSASRNPRIIVYATAEIDEVAPETEKGEKKDKVKGQTKAKRTPPRGDDAETRPNVLFLAVDDMNDWIGCMGTTPRAITPNLDRLAARGVCFTNAHTAGVFCAPSRAAIFSGQFASTTGCYRTPTYFFDHPEIEPLQVSFSKAGYQTFGAGKLFHHPAGAIDVRGWNEFFLRNQSQREGGWPLDSWSEGTPFPEPFPNSIYNEGHRFPAGLFLEWAAIPNDREEEMADTMRINWAVEKLKQNHDQPFFLGVGIYAPHFPNYCPQKYFDLYDPDKITLPPYKADDLDDLPPKIKKIKTARSRIHQKLESLNAVDDAIHGYLACISYADAMMGRVLDALEAGPYADNTIVVLWSDHGYHHGEKGDWGKHTLWERTSNVPFIWAGPGIAKGRKPDVTVSLIDMYPTFVELCDLPQPHQKLEGESLAKTLADPESAHDRNVFLPHMNPGEYAVINRDWRYIRYGEDGEELYDLQADPNEWNNLAADPKYAARKAELRKYAPATFAEPAEKLNARRDLVIDGDTFHWEKGKGNYKPPPKYRPYTEPPEGQSSETTKKNVLFIVCDDLNTHVSPAGYEPIQTPTLARLASESMTFRRAYCQYPVCGPSRASFLSGLYPQSTGILDNRADIRKERPGTVSMPQFFKEHGYWTASVGKVFHSPRQEPGEVAWHEFIRFDNDELPVVRQAREKFEAEHGSVEQGPNRKTWRELKKQVAARLDAQTPPGYGRSGLTDKQHKDGKNARQVAKWLLDRSHGEKPFFIACGIQKPHVPFLAPAKYFDLYPTNEITYIPDRPKLWDSLPKTALSKRYEAFGFELGQENDSLRREYMQAYHACVSFIDTQLKIVFDALQESGHWDDTVIVFTSDHGYHLGDHFLWGKVTLFDIGTRVPFIIRVPGVTKAGTTSDAMVELIDIYPTLTDLTGFTPPEHLQGVSLRPLLGHPERLGKKKYAYSVVRRGDRLGYALRNQRWRYGSWPDGEELYNLTNDPQEKNNLAGKPHVAERLQEFRELLAEKQKDAAAVR